MPEETGQPATVDEYISRYPEDVQRILQKIRTVIKEFAPEAQERISYGMPGYFLNGRLVWFGAHKRHIGFYPTAAGIEAFREELSEYSQSRGSVQFPLDRPVPYELIGKIVRFRVSQNLKS